MQNYNLWQSELTVRITGAALIALVAALFVAGFVAFPGRQEEIRFAAFVLGASAAIYSAYHAGINLRINLYRDRQKRSYEILDSLNQVESASIRVMVDDAMKNNAEPASLVHRTLRSDPQKDAAVRTLLSVLEDLSIGVRTGYADEIVLYRSLRSAALRYFDLFKPYIDELREDRRNPRLFIELEALVSAWRDHRSVVTRRPIRTDEVQ